MTRETTITVSGNVVNDAVLREFDSGSAVLNFRIASSSRRYDKQAMDWVDGSALYLAVSCWGQLAIRAEQALRKGKAVIVTGTLHSVEFIGSDGIRRSNLELKAFDIGLSLSRHLALYCELDSIQDTGLSSKDHSEQKIKIWEENSLEDELSIVVEEIPSQNSYLNVVSE